MIGVGIAVFLAFFFAIIAVGSTLNAWRKEIKGSVFFLESAFAAASATGSLIFAVTAAHWWFG